MSKARTVRLGQPTPRVATAAAGRKGRGDQAATWAADVLGVQLMPWQRFVLDRACRRSGKRWTHRSALTLVPRQNGKTLLTAIRVLAGMMLWEERLTIGAAQSRDVAIESWRSTLELAEDAGLPVCRVLRTTGREEFQLDLGDHRARYKVVSSTSGGGRGIPGVDLVVLDELREHRDWSSYAALEKTRRAVAGSQLWAISTMGDAESVVLNALLKQATAAIAIGQRTNPLGLWEWSPDEERDRSDVDGWYQSNPALGHTLDLATIEAEYLTDPPEVFDAEVLNRPVLVTHAWLPAALWDACESPNATVADRARVAFAVDAGPELRHASIAVAHLRDDGRLHVEIVAAFTGEHAATQCEQRLVELIARWQPVALGVIARGSVAALAARAAGDVPLVELNSADMERAVRAFYEAVVTRRLVHPPDPMLTEHVGSARQGDPGSIALRRRSTTLDIDGVLAAVAACAALDRAPEPKPVASWVAY